MEFYRKLHVPMGRATFKSSEKDLWRFLRTQVQLMDEGTDEEWVRASVDDWALKDLLPSVSAFKEEELSFQHSVLVVVSAPRVHDLIPLPAKLEGRHREAALDLEVFEPPPLNIPIEIQTLF